ncbi:MAG: glycosyltransferase [Magnetococcales bacterium]|nr:glycosyltransferase [Magnetococcales bacterium]
MFIIISTYFFIVLILFWSYCGYIILLFLLSLFTLEKETSPEEVANVRLPPLRVCVPCYNERGTILEKIRNLEETLYPAELLTITFVDGGSSDGTWGVLHELITQRAGWHLVRAPRKGKINQLNHFLAECPEGSLLLFTDADALLRPETMREMVLHLLADPEVGVVGANIFPRDAIALETEFWQDQNILRVLESQIYASSIVVAPCYLFRREVLGRFPDDCVADDIHLAFTAHSQGIRVAFLSTFGGWETRAPQTIRDYISHKFRKGNAFLVELLRFSYQFQRFPALWKVIYATKVLQLLICPWVIPYWLLGTLSLLMGDGARREIAVMGVGFLFVAFLVTSLIMKQKRQETPRMGWPPVLQRHMISGFIINNLIMLLVAVCFPFFSQDSSYRKVGSDGKTD